MDLFLDRETLLIYKCEVHLQEECDSVGRECLAVAEEKEFELMLEGNPAYGLSLLKTWCITHRRIVSPSLFAIGMQYLIEAATLSSKRETYSNLEYIVLKLSKSTIAVAPCHYIVLMECVDKMCCDDIVSPLEIETNLLCLRLAVTQLERLYEFNVAPKVYPAVMVSLIFPNLSEDPSSDSSKRAAILYLVEKIFKVFSKKEGKLASNKVAGIAEIRRIWYDQQTTLQRLLNVTTCIFHDSSIISMTDDVLPMLAFGFVDVLENERQRQVFLLTMIPSEVKDTMCVFIQEQHKEFMTASRKKRRRTCVRVAEEVKAISILLLVISHLLSSKHSCPEKYVDFLLSL